MLGRDGVIGLVLAAASAVLFYQSFDLKRLPLVPLGPGFYPRIILGMIFLASVLLVLQDLLARRNHAARLPPPAASPSPPAPARRLLDRYRLVFASFAITAAYIGIGPLLGFRVSTACFVGALQVTLDRPRTPLGWSMLVLIAAGTALVVFAAFELYLKVLLPRGRWTGF